MSLLQLYDHMVQCRPPLNEALFQFSQKTHFLSELHTALTHIEDNWLHEEPSSEYNNNKENVNLKWTLEKVGRGFPFAGDVELYGRSLNPGCPIRKPMKLFCPFSNVRFRTADSSRVAQSEEIF